MITMTILLINCYCHRLFETFAKKINISYLLKASTRCYHKLDVNPRIDDDLKNKGSKVATNLYKHRYLSVHVGSTIVTYQCAQYKLKN